MLSRSGRNSQRRAQKVGTGCECSCASVHQVPPSEDVPMKLSILESEGHTQSAGKRNDEKVKELARLLKERLFSLAIGICQNVIFWCFFLQHSISKLTPYTHIAFLLPPPPSQPSAFYVLFCFLQFSLFHHHSESFMKVCFLLFPIIFPPLSMAWK